MELPLSKPLCAVVVLAALAFHPLSIPASEASGKLAHTRVVPAEGLWFNRSEPGSGLNLERQAGLLLVTVYSYDDKGRPVWGLASGDFDGDPVFEAPLQYFSGGNPIETTTYSPALPAGEDILKLEFFGDVYASLSINGSTPQPVVPQQWGWHPQGRNIVSPFPEVGYLIPDVDAAWFLVPYEFEAGYATRFESIDSILYLDPPPAFHPLQGALPGFAYENDDGALFDCDSTARTPEYPDACRMTSPSHLWPGDQYGVFIFPVSAIDWHVWRGTLFYSDVPAVPLEQYSQPQPPENEFVVHRLGNSSYDNFDFEFEGPPHSFEPNNGMWLIPSRPGSGLVLEQKATVLVVTVFTYDQNGAPIWYLASGDYKAPPIRFVADLVEFRDGKPFADRQSPHFEPKVSGSREIVIDFLSANFAEVTIDGGTPFEIRSFNFGYAQSFPVHQRVAEGDVRNRSFADLTGFWAFTALDLTVDRTLLLEVEEPISRAGGFPYFARDSAGGSFQVDCASKGRDPKCIVRNVNLGIDVLRFRAGDIGTDRILADFANSVGTFGKSARKAWGFRIESVQ